LVKSIAKEVRAAVEQWSPRQDHRLSAGMCNVASSYLYATLTDAGYEPQLVQGFIRCDRRDPDAPAFLGNMLGAVHYWVVVGGLVVDVTADQFNRRLDGDTFEAVLIASPDELTRHIPQETVLPFAPAHGDWARAFREAPKDW
jgi:hypothetical protein